MLHARGAHLDDAAQRIVGKFFVRPRADGGLEEGLVGVGGCGLVLRPADDDAGVGFLHHVAHHVRILVLRALGAVALGVGIGRDVEQVVLQHLRDVAVDVLCEARVDLVQDLTPVVQRPHLADRLIAHAGYHALDVLEEHVKRIPLVPPVLLGMGQLEQQRIAILALAVTEYILVGGLVLDVIHARLDVHDRLERRVFGDVLDALSVDPDFAAVTDSFAVLLAGTQHGSGSEGREMRSSKGSRAIASDKILFTA